jgi:murein DD-endopeptidase MepM/ murein hydrolase activator NlpD
MADSNRTFKLRTPHMEGDDIKEWQQTLNKKFAEWKVKYKIDDDSDYGVLTRDAAATVLYGLGIRQVVMQNGVAPELRRKVRSRSLTPVEYARFVARTRWRNELRRKHAGGGVATPLARIISHSWGWHGSAHDGVDLICAEDAPIFSLCDAEVIDVRPSGWWGQGAVPSPGHPVSEGDGIIQIRCLIDAGPFKKGMHFGFGHAEHAIVRVGDKVKAGQRIGTAGYANAAHIHFMANNGGTTRGIGDRDPWPYVDYAIKHA